ncbi:hypothetical protein FGO68_gene8763 [Halteria grandinella]|uniref:Uncharacterized protein n=1 Tax=Halteria grandinella TaxID=5974 RepID=A0A8J8P365_HALGN|nr:hypothetical protein FGO68_gene8763 [Halteria grandinella]
MKRINATLNIEYISGDGSSMGQATMNTNRRGAMRKREFIDSMNIQREGDSSVVEKFQIVPLPVHNLKSPKKREDDVDYYISEESSSDSDNTYSQQSQEQRSRVDAARVASRVVPVAEGWKKYIKDNR